MPSFSLFTIGFNENTKSFHCDELNKFCLNKRILYKQVSFFYHCEAPYWSVFLEYEPVLEASKTDGLNLTEAGSICFEKLRSWRRERAEKEGIPPYVIARNSHLADIVNKEIKTKEGLKQLSGFGEGKLEKYGDDIITITKNFFNMSKKSSDMPK